MTELVDAVRNAICTQLDPFTSTVQMANAAIAAVNTFYSEAQCIARMSDAICERRNAIDWPCNHLDFDDEMAKAAYAAIQIQPK